jgi:hypothetical protein
MYKPNGVGIKIKAPYYDIVTVECSREVSIFEELVNVTSLFRIKSS